MLVHVRTATKQPSGRRLGWPLTTIALHTTYLLFSAHLLYRPLFPLVCVQYLEEMLVDFRLHMEPRLFDITPCLTIHTRSIQGAMNLAFDRKGVQVEQNSSLPWQAREVTALHSTAPKNSQGRPTFA